MNTIFKIVAALKAVSLPKSLAWQQSLNEDAMVELTADECRTVAGGDDSQTPRGGWKVV